MDLKKLAESATPKKLGAYVARKKISDRHRHAAKGSVETVREAEHGGHRIVVRTTYKIEVDGKAIRVRLGVDTLGRVHCHSLPNYQTASAVEMVTPGPTCPCPQSITHRACMALCAERY
jgi:hypothetical protein